MVRITERFNIVEYRQMCLILFAWNPDSEEQLIVAANRDEFYNRPSQTAHRWKDNHHIIAGRDLQQQGTWLGITQSGRFAAVTNYRATDNRQYPYSRGALTSSFLKSEQSPEEYLHQIHDSQHQYAGFNLLVGDTSSLHYFSNRSEQPPRRLEKGIYGLSNHLLNTPWPKVTTGIKQFSQVVNGPLKAGTEKEKALLKLLQHDQPADDALLPDTGVGKMLEKLLSPLFIRSPSYGTRASTVVQIQRTGNHFFLEQSYSAEGETARKTTYKS
ncbi:NRDE family protein [Alkalimarinus alittae]|uniref:NRDE family protein n=1 Tax=Alkalimarinus alittae TaxID=2961619 RepID=A0ABY6N0B7_9ALTE|nr:NRDE family protein [Alkalimarinus alittae]UZE95540.1 NRDE family protein [Alkalimarinus alittae]